MTRMYIVRHCEAMGNVKRIFQGSTDLDISELGSIQLEFLSKRFKDVHLDRVFSSPLIRAQKTGKAIIGNKALPLEIEKGLIELHGGVVEGRPFAECFNSIYGLADAWDNHPQDFAPQGGESMRNAYERIWRTVKNIATENKGKTVACATHGGVIRCLVCRLLKNDIRELKNTPWSENTAVTLIEFDDNLKPNVVFFNDVSHLPVEYVNSKSRIVSQVEEGAK